MTAYAHPEVLVETSWVDEHRTDPNVRLVEVDVDTWSYDEGHVPGAIGWNWNSQLCDTLRRDIVSKAKFESLMREAGIANDTTVILYGDNNNWFAAWAHWQMKMYGHRDVRLMNGGRAKWLSEGRELTLEAPSYAPTNYVAKEADVSLRAMLSETMRASDGRTANLIDVRSPPEFSGEILAPPGLPETCQRGGHIPGARSVPWGLACNNDGTFKPYNELKAVYEGAGITPDKPSIAYCRIGERSSHTWFVLKYLLGYPDVRNYDGSWTEWGNLVSVAIEKP
jgi:thiosulfate/3-mercaptopyruvate sulfurtransferase